MVNAKKLELIEIENKKPSEFSVIWLHGLGADGNDFVPIIDELDLHSHPGIKFIFPTARTIPITINGNVPMNAWYDIYELSSDKNEDKNGIKISQRLIEELIQNEINNGRPSEKIFLAGFSQGCAMTLQTGLRYKKKLAGLICLSGYLPLKETILNEKNIINQYIPIFFAHGINDNIINIEKARNSFKILKNLNYQIDWYEYEMEHSVCAEEISDLNEWLKKLLVLGR